MTSSFLLTSKVVTSEHTTRKKLNWKSTFLRSIRDLRSQDQLPAPKLKNQANIDNSSLPGETTTGTTWVEKHKRNWLTSRDLRAHKLERLKISGKPTLRGLLHFHEFYLLKLHQVLMVKNRKISSTSEGKITILKNTQSICFSLTEGCPQGKLFNQSLTKWRKGRIQISPFLPFVSHKGKCRGTLRKVKAHSRGHWKTET